MSAAQIDAVLARIDADFDASLARLFELLRIPSVSTEAAHVADCRRAAEWLAGQLKDIGFEAAVEDTPEVPSGHPMVVATDPAAPAGALKTLFYGHYDVQPVDPIALWETAPFEPTVVTRADGTKFIRARGATDDKGQLLTFVEACRAWKAETGALPIGVTLLFEGEEEAGSESMHPYLARHAERLRSDICLVCDTNMWDPKTPAITTSLRGVMGDEVIVRAASRDLHSGAYGAAARNPIALLCQILADLRDETGAVTLPGFYDGVPETPADVKANWGRLGFNEAAFLGDVGLSTPAGEAGRSVLEQIWARPTAEVNGIIGGYTGDGFKTVIPAEARAKVSFRLVGAQDPVKIRKTFRAHVRDRLPPDCEAAFIEHGDGTGITLPVDDPRLRAAERALAAEWGRPTALIGGGGSIPIVAAFRQHLGVDSLLVGFSLDADGPHSPNEKYEMTSFHGGIRSWARILAELSEA